LPVSALGLQSNAVPVCRGGRQRGLERRREVLETAQGVGASARVGVPDYSAALAVPQRDRLTGLSDGQAKLSLREAAVTANRGQAAAPAPNDGPAYPAIQAAAVAAVSAGKQAHPRRICTLIAQRAPRVTVDNAAPPD
jgi:hypothetical protein